MMIKMNRLTEYILLNGLNNKVRIRKTENHIIKYTFAPTREYTVAIKMILIM